MPHIAAFTIVVDDMRRSLEFYRQLGLDAPSSAEVQGFVVLPLGPDTHLAIKRSTTRPDPLGRSTIGVRCADAAEVDAIYRVMVAAGHGRGARTARRPLGSADVHAARPRRQSGRGLRTAPVTL